MPTRNEDLHGFVPDTAEAALLLIDLINDFDFEGSDGLVAATLPMAQRIAELKRQAKAAGIPVLYVNDNYGRWQSDFNKLVEHCIEEGCRGREITALLKPEEDDYFVLKPKHSGFFSTTLDTLLDYLKVKTLILTGVAANICVLFTANDAYMRDYRLIVPRDCVASNEPEETEHALNEMARVLKADITPSDQLDLARLNRASPEPVAV